MEAATDRKSSEERKALLARSIANEIPNGWRVESQSDYQAVLVKGRHVRHVLHLFLTLFTFGFWGVVWLVMWLIYREQRNVLEVDEWGNLTSQRHR